MGWPHPSRWDAHFAPAMEAAEAHAFSDAVMLLRERLAGPEADDISATDHASEALSEAAREHWYDVQEAYEGFTDFCQAIGNEAQLVAAASMVMA